MSQRRTFGTARQLKSGRWQARYWEDDRQVPLDGTFSSRLEANKALAQVESDLERGTHVSPKRSQGSFGDFAREYMANKTNWARTTRQDRENVWQLHVEPTFGRLAFKEITTSKIRSWHTGLHKKHPATAAGAYRLLRQILNAAVDDRRLPANPCRIKGAGQYDAPERKIATVAEVEVIFATMPDYMRVLVLLAIYVGLRRSELLGLRRGDIDLVHNTVAVGQTIHHLRHGEIVTGTGKSKAARRTVTFPSSIAADLDDHLERFVGPGRDSLLFTRNGRPLRPWDFDRAYVKARKAAGRPDLTLHDLRHTADTLAAALGATLPELMYRMGHSSEQAALRYLHATRDRDRVLGEALAELRPVAPVVPIKAARGSLGTQ